MQTKCDFGVYFIPRVRSRPNRQFFFFFQQYLYGLRSTIHIHAIHSRSQSVSIWLCRTRALPHLPFSVWRAYYKHISKNEQKTRTASIKKQQLKSSSLALNRHWGILVRRTSPLALKLLLRSFGSLAVCRVVVSSVFGWNRIYSFGTERKHISISIWSVRRSYGPIQWRKIRKSVTFRVFCDNNFFFKFFRCCCCWHNIKQSEAVCLLLGVCVFVCVAARAKIFWYETQNGSRWHIRETHSELRVSVLYVERVCAHTKIAIFRGGTKSDYTHTLCVVGTRSTQISRQWTNKKRNQTKQRNNPI